MAKAKTVFVCTECGYESGKWMGRCSGCGSWNTMVEQQAAAPAAPDRRGASMGRVPAAPIHIKDVTGEEVPHIPTGIAELDRVLGGGYIEGGVLLLGGEPGVGKSTLLLQACDSLSLSGKRVLYVSGEESVRQVSLRARRLGVAGEELFVLAETLVSAIRDSIEKIGPQVVVIDSIQTIYLDTITSAPGSVAQVRESAAYLMSLAKETGFYLIFVGHVTKEGAIAGPRVLEHMVDTVLYFEGERQSTLRVLRAVKNRFGSTNEIGIFEMQAGGMVAVEDASAYMLSSMTRGVAGVSVTCSVEGSRPMMCEVQALVTDTSYGNPRRMCQGVEFNRMVLMIAVLERRAGISLASRDVYMNAVGGMRMAEPSGDLAVIAALASAALDMPLLEDTVFIGEVGLSGEIRHVSQMERRIQECARLGFSTVVLPPTRGVKKEDFSQIRLLFAKDVSAALAATLRKGRKDGEQI